LRSIGQTLRKLLVPQSVWLRKWHHHCERQLTLSSVPAMDMAARCTGRQKSYFLDNKYLHIIEGSGNDADSQILFDRSRVSDDEISVYTLPGNAMI
jgi:hypothetical protein